MEAEMQLRSMRRGSRRAGPVGCGLAGLAVMAVAVVGCGDDSVEALSKEDYLAQGNAICAATYEVVDPLLEEFFTTAFVDLPDGPTTQAENQEVVEAFDSLLVELTPQFEEQTSQLRALGAPDEDADLLAALYDDYDRALEEINATLDAAVAGDEDATESVLASDGPFEDENQRAHDYGLTVCGEPGEQDDETGTADGETTTDESAGTADVEATVLALGDSFFEWNVGTGESIPDVIGEFLGRPVVNAAVGGAHFSNPDLDAAAAGLDVRQQFVDGDWVWVVMDGGGNDLNDDCGCGACESVLDVLVSVDGRSGEIPDFTRSLVEDGTQVMFVGYYEVPSDAEFGFDRCIDEGAEHGRRLEAMAAAIEGVWFVSAGDVVSADNRLAYSKDRVHPSPAGSRLVGEHVAAAIASAEGKET